MNNQSVENFFIRAHWTDFILWYLQQQVLVLATLLSQQRKTALRNSWGKIQNVWFSVADTVMIALVNKKYFELESAYQLWPFHQKSLDVAHKCTQCQRFICLISHANGVIKSKATFEFHYLSTFFFAFLPEFF